VEEGGGVKRGKLGGRRLSFRNCNKLYPGVHTYQVVTLDGVQQPCRLLTICGANACQLKESAAASTVMTRWERPKNLRLDENLVTLLTSADVSSILYVRHETIAQTNVAFRKRPPFAGSI